MQLQRVVSLILFYLLTSVSSAYADTLSTQDKTKQVWQLLDYLTVDYGRSVKDGQAANVDEYAETQEFAHATERQIAELPAGAQTQVLLKDTGALHTLTADKSTSATAGEQAHKLAGNLLTAYPMPMAPSKVPDLKRDATLYQSQCAFCRGSSGRVDGPLATKPSPPPIALADHQRAQERSVLALQQIITCDVEGTSMPSFAQLTDDDRWALAYFASTSSYSNADRQAGAKLWASRPELHSAVPTLAKFSQTPEALLAKTINPDAARQLTVCLRSTPGVLNASNTDSLMIAKDKLKKNVAAFDQDDKSTASRLALSAYLDGFEPVEPVLAAKNQSLLQDIERTMGLYHNAITTGQAEQVREIAQHLQTTLIETQDALGGTNDPPSTFLGVLTIPLREGLEALLVVVAMMAFLEKAECTDVLPYVRAGWIAALAAGGLTWAIVTYLVDLSGASREMTEGFSAIFAAVALLGAGMRMHRKSLAGRWQAYVKQKLSSAPNKRSVIMLFVLSFMTVYHEVFETVLFYVALWSEGNGIYLLAGLGSGITILAVIAVVLSRSSARLPVGRFFAFSSALVGVLAVVLIGKGVVTLQKVGFLHITPISMPRIDVLGIYPSMQTVIVQVTILPIIALSIAYDLRSQKASSGAQSLPP